VSRSFVVRPWKWGRAEGLIFLILVSPLVYQMGKVPSILSPFPLASLCSAVGSKWIFSSSSSLIGSSNMSRCSPNGSSWLQPPKRENVGYVKQWGCWEIFFLSYLYSYEAWKEIFLDGFCFFFPTLKVPAKLKLIEQNELQLTELNLLKWNF